VPDSLIRLYGDRPSFDPKAGPLVGLVEVEGAYLFDRERCRCRIEALPGTELEKWTSPVGVLLLARRGWWGLKARLDTLPVPLDRVDAIHLEDRYRRPFLPRDLASCPRCGSAVVLHRSRHGSGFRMVTPSRRLASSAAALLKSSGLFGFVAQTIRGKGRKAGRDHSLDCYGLPIFRTFAAAKEKKKRQDNASKYGWTKRPRPGRPRNEAPVKSPFPRDQARQAEIDRKQQKEADKCV
jgi:hypothetical protein